MKLTATNVAKFKMPGGKSEHIEWDEGMPGFGLRCRAGDAREHRTYIVQYKIGAKHRRITLGNASKIGTDAARAKAKQVFGKLVDGNDPANERAKARAEAGNTFDVISADFLSFQKNRIKAASYEATERYIMQHWKPLHGLALAGINRATVAAQLRVIAKERGAVSADRARAAMSKFFTWAMGEGLSDHNPVVGTNKSAVDYEAGDRVLTDAELAAIWKSAPDGDFGSIVRLLALTTCRRDEISSLRWSEIDLRQKLITLPPERTKNSRAHDVPLSREALAILDKTPQQSGRDFVFGEGAGGFSGWSKAKARLDAHLATSVKPWTLHDLRRTGATRMADSGVQPHIIEAVLNHISGHKGGVAGIYNRAAYEPEKRAALDTLASYIKTALVKSEGARLPKRNAS